ncbi:hypothetical protein, partial [Klebsiella quasipneumoniae]
VRSLRHKKQSAEKLTGSAMCAEATDNINDHTALLPLTLALSPRETELSGHRFRGQHIAGWRLRLTRPTESENVVNR